MGTARGSEVQPASAIWDNIQSAADRFAAGPVVLSDSNDSKEKQRGIMGIYASWYFLPNPAHV